MYKAKLKISVLMIMFAIGAKAQTPATELVKNNPVVQLERGQSIDVYGEYTVVGSTFGINGLNGAAMLFYNSQHIRDYRVSSNSDGEGRRGTIGIDQHALVMTSPEFKDASGNIKGRLLIFNKTWNGTHYNPTLSQSFTESTTGTGFGQVVSISDNWIAVGAPNRNVEGGVKLYFRNPSTGVWEDKGWLPLPNLENAPHRYRTFFGGSTLHKVAASFGSTLQLHHNNMIIGAPGIGSFYIYEFDGSAWRYKSENKGTKDLGHVVAISDEYAASATSALEMETFKKSYSGTNLWPYLQTIQTESPVRSIATDGNRMVLGEPSALSGAGKATYYEVRSHQLPGTNTWVNDFVKIGKMFVSTTASPNGLKDCRLLGHSVAIHQNTVVAGAPNAQYTGFADGAGFKGNFSQYTSARMSKEENEEEQTVSALTLYPNPASSVVSISTTSKILNASAVNVLGEKLSLDFNGNQINTSKLAQGTYIISVQTESGTISKQVIIQ
jgi:hypothetical protein